MRKLGMLLVVSLLGCDAQVLLNEGGSAEVGLTSGSGGSSATGGSASSGGSSADGGGGPAPFDAVAACDATCNRPCVGGPSTCMELCLQGIVPNCEREAFEAYECSMWYCDPDCDPEALESAVLDCINPFYCGHAGNEVDCGDWISDECDCFGECDAGHVGRVNCDEAGQCDCYFDGALVATCVGEPVGCDFQSSCCAPFMLPGGGPAAEQ